MIASPAVSIRIDLAHIRENVRQIASRTRVPIYAVVKADAYGLGVVPVTDAIKDLVEAWCVFSVSEAAEARLFQRTGRPSITLGPAASLWPADYIEHHVRPGVSTVEQAAALCRADPLLCVDTGMQRFACPPERVEAVLQAAHFREAFTHATALEHARKLRGLLDGRGLRLHAAASNLLEEPEALLDAVRPGLAMYRGALHVSARLIEAGSAAGPLGYTGFKAPRHGVILCGYSNGLRKGPCLVNGQRRQILEVGMQSAYVEVGPADRVGDAVVLMGEGLSEDEVAAAWASTPHEAIFALSHAGRREYV